MTKGDTPLEHAPSQTITFFRKFLYLLNATFRIRVGTTWRPDPLILGIGPRKIKFIPIYFCAMYLENIMLPLVPLLYLLYLLYLLPECP